MTKHIVSLKQFNCGIIGDQETTINIVQLRPILSPLSRCYMLYDTRLSNEDVSDDTDLTVPD